MIIQIVSLNQKEKEATLQELKVLIQKSKAMVTDIRMDSRVDLTVLADFKRTLEDCYDLLEELEEGGTFPAGITKPPLLQTSPIQIRTTPQQKYPRTKT